MYCIFDVCPRRPCCEMYRDARSTCKAIVLIILPFVLLRLSLTCRNNFVFLKNVMTFQTFPLVQIGPYSQK